MARQGFTIIEMLIVMAIISAVASLSSPFILAYMNRNDLDVAVNTLVQTGRRAQTMSTGVESDSQWGVQVGGGKITLFKGGSYSGRDSSFDENYDISPNISLSGITEIAYTKVFGLPSATGTTTLTNGNDTRTVTINGKGVFSY